jgi:hypothetical protein
MVGVGTAASWWEVGNRSAGPRREEQGQSICSAAAAATADTMGRTTLQRHERGATNEVDVSAVRRQSSIASRQSPVVSCRGAGDGDGFHSRSTVPLQVLGMAATVR